MAKKILRDTSPELAEKLLGDFKAFLESKRKERLQLTDIPQFNFSFSLGDNGFDDRRATLRFTPKAYAKMYALVITYNTEVQWHGLVTRTAEREFLVEDILTFPHEVSEATVTSDQGEYNQWLDSLPDDIFNKVRLHGHSHVNMGCTPSAVDTAYQKKILNLFETPNENNDVFYIFMIVNKRGEVTSLIYDLQYNALYNTNEITISVEFEDGETLENFIKETGKKVTVPTPRPLYPLGVNSTKKTKGKAQQYSPQTSMNYMDAPARDDEEPDEWDYSPYNKWRYPRR